MTNLAASSFAMLVPVGRSTGMRGGGSDWVARRNDEGLADNVARHQRMSERESHDSGSGLNAIS